MKKFTYLLSFFLFVFTFNVIAQTYYVPELIYYKFENNPNTTTIMNFASTPVGSNPVAISTANSLTTGGQFDTCMSGTGVTSSGIATNWLTNLGSGSWTISMWLNNLPSNTTLYYLFGDATGSFRCFLGGVAGTGSIILRGTGITDVNVGVVAPGPMTIHFVYDSATATIKTYKNGIFYNAIVQTPLNLATGTGFKVGAYSTSAGLNGLMDEFRVYRRALDSAEIAYTWNHELPSIVPVELTSFTASCINGAALLSWETATELNNFGFDVERIYVDNGSAWAKVGFVNGNGTRTEPMQYSFIDKSFDKVGTYKYRLKQIDINGEYEYSNEVEVNIEPPREFSLSQNYPNPFNPGTVIAFSIPTDEFVSLKVYNSLGQEVSTLVNQVIKAGTHTVNFNAANLMSGVYYYTLKAGSFVQTNKMSLMK
jgi:hypothetical protein